ncbi:MAG: hypothetical protein AAGA85_14215 [Bacteroidota bacterium]
MRTRLPILLALWMASLLVVHAQEAKQEVSPYDLISKYYQEDFNPFRKGNGYLGFAFSLRDRNLQNTQRLFDRVVKGDEFNYDLTLKGGYFIGDYVVAGVNVNYERDEFEGTLVDSNSDTLFRQSISSGGLVTPNIKAYFPLVPTERLSFSTEIGLGFGGGNTLRTDTRNVDEITRTYVEDFVFSAGLSPGIVFFAIENFAFEVEINNLIGYRYTNSTTSINNVEDSQTNANEVSFQIDLLSLRLGLAYYFKGKNARR